MCRFPLKPYLAKHALTIMLKNHIAAKVSHTGLPTIVEDGFFRRRYALIV